MTRLSMLDPLSFGSGFQIPSLGFGGSPATMFPGLSPVPTFGFDGADNYLDGGSGMFDPLALQQNGNDFAADPRLSAFTQWMQQQMVQREMRGGMPSSGFDPLGLGGQQGLGDANAMQLMELLALLVMMMQQGTGRDLGQMNSAPWSGGSPASWGGGSGGNSAGGPSSGTSGTSGPSGNTTPSVGGNSSAFQVAESVLNRNIADLKVNGPLADVLDKWPGNNVCCANFVSACLEKAGQIPHSEHNDNVKGLADNLSKDPNWQQVDLKDAKPGDVVCMNVPGEGPYGHVVMFAGWKDGKPQFIGSNNVNSDGSQRITEGPMNYGITAVFHYHG